MDEGAPAATKTPGRPGTRGAQGRSVASVAVPARIFRLATAGFVALAFVLIAGAAPAAAAPCDAPITNPVACENTKPGNPASEWDVSGAGEQLDPGLRHRHQRRPGRDGRLQGRHDRRPPTGSTSTGWATTAATGARKVATVRPVGDAAAEPAGLPDRRRDRPGRLRQLGGVGSWAVPADAVSGIYFAKLVREDGTAGASHIVFVVRDDDGHSDLLFQTSDTTWQAYNQYGGNSLYAGAPGRARLQGQLQPPVHHARQYAPEDWVFNAEYPMVRLLEATATTSATPPASTPTAAAPSCSSTRSSCRSATTSTGRAASAPTSRRRATPA